MGKLSLFIPITKVDITHRLVYGVATAEVEDRAGEICDYESTKPHYERWSDEIAQSTSGKSLGNLRAMHGPVAAGKVTAINFNDEAKQIEICAKVVDDAEWAKVTEGVYTGFSQGGSYERRWTESDGRTRYTAVPNEISLVDLPCLPQARFEMIKTDGTREMHAFEPCQSVATKLEDLIGELDWLKSLTSGELVDVPELTAVIDDLHASSVYLSTVLQSIQSGTVTPGSRTPRGPRARIDATNRTSAPGESVMPRHVDPARRDREGRRDHLPSRQETTTPFAYDRFGPTSSRWGLEKKYDALATTLADVLQRVKNIEQQPLPLPLSSERRLVAKHEDGALDLHTSPRIDTLLADPEALSILAIRLAQRNGRGPSR